MRLFIGYDGYNKSMSWKITRHCIILENLTENMTEKKTLNISCAYDNEQ